MTTPHKFNYTAILTSYNSEKTIRRAVEGILNQTFVPEKIIIIDDASTDNSVRIAEDLLSGHPNTLCMSIQINAGQSYCRNLAASLTQSEFIVFFDDDDLSLPSRVQVHAELFAMNSSLNFVSSRIVYENGHRLDAINLDCLIQTLTPSMAIERVLLGNQGKGSGLLAIPASTSAYKRVDFLNLGGFDINFRRLEDAEIFVRYASAGLPIAWSSSLLVERFSTSRELKGGEIEMLYEKKLLLKHGSQLTPEKLKSILTLIELRRLYFSKSYVALFFRIFTDISSFLVFLGKFGSGFRRVIHDIRRKFL
jgi:glycosyltransferase involved in cell wall biosynthesis